MIQPLKAWWMQNFVVDKSMRQMFYEVLAAQLEAGLTPQQAFDALSKEAAPTPDIASMAETAAQAGHEGRLLCEGLEESCCIPALDLSILLVAEKNQSMLSACHTLHLRTTEHFSILTTVLLSNAYYAGILAVLIGMIWQAQGVLDQLAKNINVQHLTVYQLSLFIQLWLLPITALAAVYILIVLYGRSRFISDTRRWLLFFDQDYRAHLAIRFADMAQMLATQGATHADVLSTVQTAFTGSPYIADAIDTAKQRFFGEGEAIETALADTLLPPSLAQLLKALTPGGEQARYPKAYESLAKVQKAKLKAGYRKAASMFRTAILVSIAVLLLTIIQGIFGALSVQL